MTFKPLDEQSRRLLESATSLYQGQLRESPDAIDYLKMRGLTGPNCQYFRLGVVDTCLETAGHEMFKGRLAIPYQTSAGIVSIRFRCIQPHDCKTERCPKYMGLAGDRLHIFNTPALEDPSPDICICEGEIDAMSCRQAGLPAVGIAGVNGWKRMFRRAFRGYRNVFIMTDNDDKGQGLEWAEEVANDIGTTSRITLMPKGHDVNSLLQAEGTDGIINLLKGGK